MQYRDKLNRVITALDCIGNHENIFASYLDIEKAQVVEILPL